MQRTSRLLVEGYGLFGSLPTSQRAIRSTPHSRRGLDWPAAVLGNRRPRCAISPIPAARCQRARRGRNLHRRSAGDEGDIGTTPRRNRSAARRTIPAHGRRVGVVDEDGFFYIVDRIKDLIICSGYNVYPRRIEEALYEHAAVEEAIVIGIADKYWGEAPKAFIKLQGGRHGDDSRN